MRSAPRDLLGRVTWAATVSAATAALIAAVFAALVAERVITKAEERRLLGQAAALLSELSSMSRDEAAREVGLEVRELEAVGLRIAVVEGGVLLGGDPTIASSGVGCQVADGVRRCGVAGAGRTCVVGTRELIAGRFATFGIAALVAVAIAATLGTLIGRRRARWAVEPLSNLAERVSRAESNIDLGPDDGVREVDELRHALDTAWSRLGEALATARRFSANAAHELRTPLSALSAELELIEERMPAFQPQLTRARATTAKLAKLTERLLALARATDGVPLGDAVELGELATQVVGGLADEERDRVGVEPGEGTIRGDEALVEALMENAIQNALRHGRGAVRVSIDEAAGQVVLGVRDEGPGVPVDEQDRMFEPFVRGRGGEGHGLGLALIAHVARAHGGSARFRSDGPGAHLVVTFPAWAPRPPTPRAPG